MADYRSGSSLRAHPIKDLFLPNPLIILLYILISLIALSAINLAGLWQLLLGQPVTELDVAPLTERFSAFQDRLGAPTVMVFWLFIGAATYTLIWFLQNVAFIAKSEVAASQYVSGGKAAKSGYLRSALAANGFLVLMILALVIFIALYLRLLLPAFSNRFHEALFSTPTSKILLNIALAVILNSLAIYAILLMSRIINYTWRSTRP